MSQAATTFTVQTIFSSIRWRHLATYFLSLADSYSTHRMQNASISSRKQALRLRVRKDLKAMTPPERSQQSNAIQNFILEAPWFKSSMTLCVYISSEALQEVDTSVILSEVLDFVPIDDDMKVKKMLFVPRIEAKTKHMRMLSISKDDDLVSNSMNILEPALVDAQGNEHEDVMKISCPVDLFLLPGLAFDRSGRRLGRGGGYYDKFLREYKQLVLEQQWEQPLLVGLSYSQQLMEHDIIPVTLQDIPVDAVVTPASVIPVSPAAATRMKSG